MVLGDEGLELGDRAGRVTGAGRQLVAPLVAAEGLPRHDHAVAGGALAHLPLLHRGQHLVGSHFRSCDGHDNYAGLSIERAAFHFAIDTCSVLLFGTDDG